MCQSQYWREACPCPCNSDGIALEHGYMMILGAFGVWFWSCSLDILQAVLSEEPSEFATSTTSVLYVIFVIEGILLFFEFMKFVGMCLKWKPKSPIRVILYFSNIALYVTASFILLSDERQWGRKHDVLWIGVLGCLDCAVFLGHVVTFNICRKLSNTTLESSLQDNDESSGTMI